MAKTRHTIIRQFEKHPLSGRLALRILLDIGCRTAAQMTFDESEERLKQIEPDSIHKRAMLKNTCELVRSISLYEHEFIFDLIALSAEHISADKLKAKYANESQESED